MLHDPTSDIIAPVRPRSVEDCQRRYGRKGPVAARLDFCHGLPAVLLLAAGLIAAPCLAQPDVTFEDIAPEVGFQHRSHGRALVAADWNRDGWVDFYVGNPALPAVADDESFIVWNEGPDAEGTFRFTKGQVLFEQEVAFTASAADIDNDGDQDLFVGIGGQEGIGLDYLFVNQDGTFVDVSAQAGIRGPIAPDGRSVPVSTSSGTWADYDNDGDLDLFTASRWHLFSLDIPGFGRRDSLWRNEGDGTFTDVSAAAGVASNKGSMTAAWGDFDNDGWMDLFVPHHQPAGFSLYRNRGDGTFARVPIDPEEVEFGSRAVWAASVADFDKDGRLDIISYARRDPQRQDPDSHALLINQGDWRFENLARDSGLAPIGEVVPAVMGTAVGDFDNDGYPDLFMGNGGPLWGEADTLVHNTTRPGEPLSFEMVSHLIDFPGPPDPGCDVEVPLRESWPAWVDHYAMTQSHAGDPGAVRSDELDPSHELDPCDPPYPYRGHGAVFVDFDRDGDLDLPTVKGGTALVAPDVFSAEPDRFFRNDGGNANNALFVELEGTLSNREGYGAKIEVVSSDAGADPVTTVRQVQGNTGFSASGPREVHFGLGSHDTVDEVRVTWPSGLESVLTGAAVNERIALREETRLAHRFEDAAPGWQPVAGDWAVLNGRYTQRAAGPTMALNHSVELADGAVAATVTTVTGDGRTGVLARVSEDGSRYYAALLEDDEAKLFKNLGDGLVPLGEPLAIEPLRPGKSHVVRIDLAGDELRLTVNRSAAAPVTDPDLAAGGIGLVTTDTRAAFDNVGVQ